MTNTKQLFQFNEPEWLKLLFLLSDTQEWLDDMNKKLFNQLPVSKKDLSARIIISPCRCWHIYCKGIIIK